MGARSSCNKNYFRFFKAALARLGYIRWEPNPWINAGLYPLLIKLMFHYCVPNYSFFRICLVRSLLVHTLSLIFPSLLPSCVKDMEKMGPIHLKCMRRWEDLSSIHFHGGELPCWKSVREGCWLIFNQISVSNITGEQMSWFNSLLLLFILAGSFHVSLPALPRWLRALLCSWRAFLFTTVVQKLLSSVIPFRQQQFVIRQK